MRKFTGLGVAMVTPFDTQGKVDEQGLKNLTNYLVDGGVDFLVVQGTTGEAATLTKQEKSRTLEIVQETNNGRLPVVYGIGGNNTALVCEQLKNAPDSIDGVLSVSPYYNKPTQHGIYEHYKAISNSSDLPIILYNVPGRTSSNVQADTTLKIASDFENIVAVKEASGNLEQVMEIIKGRPDNFTVLSGDDALTLPMMAAGADGVISVVGNAYPSAFSAMVKAMAQGQMVEARINHYALLPIIQAMFAEGNPAGVKEFLSRRGVCDAHVRLPLVGVSKELHAFITALDKELLQVH
ncbi:MAG: 4-hydroxy-tetrahydrodipicolinate synthase [Bacteroidota bacterium]